MNYPLLQIELIDQLTNQHIKPDLHVLEGHKVELLMIKYPII